MKGSDKELTYKEFIDNILQTRGRFNCGDEYHERHHILPKSCGGTSDKENLIDLFAKEHFIAHKLLAEENPHNEKLVCAYAIMAFATNDKEKRYKLSPDEYEQARKALSESRKEKFKDKTKHPNYGKHLSEETRKKISEANKGNKKCLGRVLSEETKRKIGDANRNPSAETRKKMSESQKIAQAGDKNSRAKKVIQLSTGKIYTCGKYAAEENGINYSTFKDRIRNHRGDFMYYEDWIKQQKTEK